MMVAVISSYRNMTGRVGPALERVGELARLLQGQWGVRHIAVEGDSVDGTRAELEALAPLHGVDLQLVVHEHGGREYGSVDDPVRMDLLTGVLEAGHLAVEPHDDLVLRVESDLLWDPQVALALLKRVAARDQGYEVLAPMIMRGGLFYDTWAFRRHGVRFRPLPPYHPLLLGHEVFDVDSVGSCLVTTGQACRTVVCQGRDALVSWCDGARAMGMRIGVVTGLEVEHP